jgi:sugar lactone lactonase YvrE
MLARRPRRRAPLVAIALALALTITGFAGLASGKDLVGWFGSATGSGTLGGQFNNPRTVAAHTTSNGPAVEGDIYVVDDNNNRIQRFDADGNFVSAWGANVENASVNEVQTITVDATGGTFKLKFHGAETAAIAEAATATQVQTALRNVSTIGSPNVNVTGSAGGPWTVTFVGSYAGTQVEQLTGDGTLLTGGAGISIETATQGAGAYEICTAAANCIAGTATGAPNEGDTAKNGALDNPQSVAVDDDTGNVYVSDRDNRRINEYDGIGNFIRSFGWDVDADEPGTGYEVCAAAHRCKFGLAGAGIGQLSTSNSSGINGLAVTPPDGEVPTGTLFLADSGNRRVSTYKLDGTTPGSFGDSSTFESTQPTSIAVDSRGIVYASNSNNENEIERYDSEDFNGGGVKFLEPLIGARNEEQIVALNGLNFESLFTLSCPGGGTTGAIAYTTAGNTMTNAIKATLEEDCGGSYYIAQQAFTQRRIIFEGMNEHTDLPPTICTVTGGPGTCNVISETNGRAGGLLRGSGSNATSGLAVDAATNALFVMRVPSTVFLGPPVGNTRLQQFGPANDPGLAIAPVQDDEQHAANAGFGSILGLGLNPSTGRLYVSASQNVSGIGTGHRVHIIDVPTPPTATVDSITNITATTANITGTVNPNTPLSLPNPPPVTGQLQYKLSSEADWKPFGPAKNFGIGQLSQSLVLILSSLIPNRSYDVRILTTTTYGSVIAGESETFSTLAAPPRVEGVFSSNVTKNSADVTAAINPLGQAATYRIEYGPTPAYGTIAPQPEGALPISSSAQTVTVHLDGLKGITYHFRVFTENEAGATTSQDQTFSFYPEACPNSVARQQTGAGHLPDCRAYELVSPEEAGTINLFSVGAPSPEASNPPRHMYAGAFGTLEGVNAPNYLWDSYTATRKPTGWETHYTGISADIAGGVGGPPGLGGPGGSVSAVADEGLDHILQWRYGPASLFAKDFFYNGTQHYGPYVHGPDGSYLGRYPTNLGDVPGADNPIYYSFDLNPIDDPANGWTGDQALSRNGKHYFFSTNRYQFAPGGRVEPNAGPGSVYDNDLNTGEVAVVSKLPGTEGGGDIPAESTVPNHFIEVFDSSRDGSHLLIGAPSVCSATSFKECGQTFEYTTAHLYMRVGGASGITYDVSQGHRVLYKGMTDDGRLLYFTSAEQLTSDDTDTSVDLYMWREDTEEITRVSDSPEGGGIGNSDECNVTWTANCDVEVVPASRGGGFGNEANFELSEAPDNSIAADSGDIYFFSPEQLVASNAAPEGKNLYVRRGNGHTEFVGTFEPAENRRIVRIQVTPDGRFAAFLTASPLTNYDNGGQEMVYRFDAEHEEFVCGSCLPSGDPPPVRNFPGREKVIVSTNGLFLSDDGRMFWTTVDPLVARDTNGEDDVYEYTGGRPQLITTGLGDKAPRYEFADLGNFFGKTGTLGVRLAGVSADGVDVYFATTETLVAQDRNGDFQKIYDARTNGGFPVTAEVAPCKAADECHAPTSAPPVPPAVTSGADLAAGGNIVHRKKTKKKAKRKSRRHKRRHDRGNRKKDKRGAKRHPRRHNGREGK